MIINCYGHYINPDHVVQIVEEQMTMRHPASGESVLIKRIKIDLSNQEYMYISEKTASLNEIIEKLNKSCTAEMLCAIDEQINFWMKNACPVVLY